MELNTEKILNVVNNITEAANQQLSELVQLFIELEKNLNNSFIMNDIHVKVKCMYYISSFIKEDKLIEAINKFNDIWNNPRQEYNSNLHDDKIKLSALLRDNNSGCIRNVHKEIA